MGKIDKEKLLKELPCTSSEHCVEYQCKHHRTSEGLTVSECIGKVIKNFPEEPEQPIDFDALWKDYKNHCFKLDIKCGRCDLNTEGNDGETCFTNFLKSKNLTAPQIDMDQLRHDVYSEIMKSKETKQFEIPVNRTWTLKKEYVNFFEKMINQTCTLKVKTIKQPEHVEFYDYSEEHDYSKIPNWSIVELVNKDTKRRHVFIMKECYDGEMFDTEGLSYTMGLYTVRIVELAKG